MSEESPDVPEKMRERNEGSGLARTRRGHADGGKWLTAAILDAATRIRAAELQERGVA